MITKGLMRKKCYKLLALISKHVNVDSPLGRRGGGGGGGGLPFEGGIIRVGKFFPLPPKNNNPGMAQALFKYKKTNRQPSSR